MSLGLALLWFSVAYVAATVVGVGHTFFNWKVLGMTAPAGPIETIYDLTPYARTVPYHPLYNIVVWPAAAYSYLAQSGPAEVWGAAGVLAVVWTSLVLVVDLVGWVLIRHPWSMTLREMYIGYQPWITLIYVSIVISPFAAALAYQA